MGVILLNTADYDMVRGYAGVQIGLSTVNLPDAVIASDVYLGDAEAFISQRIAAQSTNGVPSVSVIMSSAVTAPDRVFLRAAVARYIVHLYAVAMTNDVNTAETFSTGDTSQTIDLGGIGTQWITLREKALADSDRALKSITNWREYRLIPAV